MKAIINKQIFNVDTADVIEIEGSCIAFRYSYGISRHIQFADPETAFTKILQGLKSNAATVDLTKDVTGNPSADEGEDDAFLHGED